MIIPMVREEQLEMLLIYTSAVYTLGPFSLKDLEKVIREEFKEDLDVKLNLKRIEGYLDSHFLLNTNKLLPSAKFKSLRRNVKNGYWLYSLNLLLDSNVEVCVEKIRSMLISAEACYKVNLNNEKTRSIEKKEYLFLSQGKTFKLWYWAEQNGKLIGK